VTPGGVLRVSSWVYGNFAVPGCEKPGAFGNLATQVPPWPIDGALCGSNLSAMAAKCGAEGSKVACFTVRANGDPS